MAHDIWHKTLAQLKLQMTRATFEAWLQGTVLLEYTDGVYRIAVKNKMAQDWLEHRLLDQVQRTLANIAGEAVTVEFVVAQCPTPLVTPAPFAAPLLAPPSASPLAAVDYQQLWNSTGFIKLDHYANIFWRRYLGRAFDLWLYLQAKPMSREYLQQGWTPSRKFRFREVAQSLKASPNSVKGAAENCYYLRLAADLGRPLAACCNRFAEAHWQPQDTAPRCLHWRTGWLEVLFAEKLLAVAEVKAADKPRSHLLQLQVWRILPILTPFQVSRLSESEQERHDRWLEQYGHLAQPPLTLTTWEAEPARTLVPLLTEPPYERGRTNFDIYQPNTLNTPDCIHEDAMAQEPEDFCIHEDANTV